MLSHKNLSKNSIEEGEVFLIDKPLNYTSFQVVKKLRNILKNKFNLDKLKVGHAGTLDPLASGLLIICTGRMTKQISDFQNLDKEYVGTMSIGSTTPSYDLETKIDRTFSTDHVVHPSRSRFQWSLRKFYLGARQQNNQHYKCAK